MHFRFRTLLCYSRWILSLWRHCRYIFAKEGIG